MRGCGWCGFASAVDWNDVRAFWHLRAARPRGRCTAQAPSGTRVWNADGVLRCQAVSPPRQDPPAPLIGRTIDSRYALEARLGQGAAGSVFLARELTGAGRPVAVKVWHRSAMDEQVLGRFRREAAALDLLVHPNVVEIYGSGFIDGLPYMAMELLKGRTLEEVLQTGRSIHPSRVVDLFRQLLEALAFAHGRSLVHRDLKPENLFLVRRQGGGHTVKVLDYGLAKFMSPGAAPEGDLPLTAQGAVIGTPLYMPPEQAAGGEVGFYTDVYAAGCVLYELFTGVPPYLADTLPEIAKLHYTAPVPQLAEHRDDIPGVAAIQRLLGRAMAKAPGERFADAAEMLAAFCALPSS